MLASLKKLFADSVADETLHAREFEQLAVAVAGIVQEMMRVDLHVKPGETQAAEAALVQILALPAGEARALLDRASGHRFTSYYGPVSIMKRMLTLEQRTNLVEMLWRIAFSDDGLDPHEDHFVRKIAHLLYVPNTDTMLARQRARMAVRP